MLRISANAGRTSRFKFMDSYFESSSKIEASAFSSDSRGLNTTTDSKPLSDATLVISSFDFFALRPALTWSTAALR